MMKPLFLYFLLFGFVLSTSSGQSNFPYKIELNPITIEEMPGLHSYVFAVHENKWLLIGGRKDGIHARQPFNAFPFDQNNRDIYVVDMESKQVWSSSVNLLPLSIAEQLQSTNMNFYQDGEMLFITGGYAFSPTANNHITFPFLIAVEIPDLIDAIVDGVEDIQNYFRQVEGDVFAVTGGQMGKLGDYFFLIGGHRFDGRYNPQGPNHGPGFNQEYTNQIRKFKILHENGLEISDYSAITDPIHLRRRDYNLVPQVLPNGEEGYMISSGVFQIHEDLPFLYPVFVSEDGYHPTPEFNQYLSNYHSPKIGIYDSSNSSMHSLFFGGISQYYYDEGQLVQDNLVPFVNTISGITRGADGQLTEFVFETKLPALQGAGAELIINQDLPQFGNKTIDLMEVSADTILLGHIFGGIQTQLRNPFSFNRTNETSADNLILEVRLLKKEISNVIELDGSNPYQFDVYPNPASSGVNLGFYLDNSIPINYYISSTNGRLLEAGFIKNHSGNNKLNLPIEYPGEKTLIITLIFENRYYYSRIIQMIR